MVNASQSTVSFCEQQACALAFQTIRMLDAGGTYISTGGGKIELFIIQGGAVVFDIKLGDNEVNAVLFEFAISKTVCSEKFGSAHFKPDRVNRVVDDAGLVGFAISWDNGYCMAINFNFFGKFHIFSLSVKISRNKDFCKPEG